jgi:hypothetical protein
MNGPEDAHDYLWLTQDLWMDPDVWNWADQNPEIKASVRRLCCREGCGKIESTVAEFKRCAACKTVCFVIAPRLESYVHRIYTRFGTAAHHAKSKTGALTSRVSLLLPQSP